MEKCKVHAIFSMRCTYRSLATGTNEAKEFVRRSQCGKVGKETLVCCGSYVLEKPRNCTTSNGERAGCISISKCQIMLDALKTLNTDAIDFAKNSQCGYDKEALVCCGSEAYSLRSNLFPDRSICGDQKGDVIIHGGNVAHIFEFPWTAPLKYTHNNGSDAEFKCGGSLINNRYILTVAHCVSLLPYLEIHLDGVRLGEWRISTTTDCEEGKASICTDPVVDLKIEEGIVHPQYSRRKFKNNIALLRLERNIEYTDFIQPICLPVSESPDLEPGFKMPVAG
ncbi:hypothetical protein ILUMI_25090 [Ignelater luminosus]|uniref:CLIP domain-containing serine protease n=1 Tax=Ignelater luminosus TaxID=2038154 RepID=A0A8K0CAM5_IGNLU|nr:hypothetical protein ILUMI_25090 [Ignelater luminosus]